MMRARRWAFSATVEQAQALTNALEDLEKQETTAEDLEDMLHDTGAEYGLAGFAEVPKYSRAEMVNGMTAMERSLDILAWRLLLT